MTIPYSKDVATSSFAGFLKLLLRWRGSIYKFVWKHFAVFAVLYTLISIIYRFALNEDEKRTFEYFAEYCQTYSGLIPLGFILGFYVSVVVNRFWQQLNELPWPHRVGFFVSAMIHGNDEQGRMLRRTIMRYLTVAYILTMKDICPPVRRRFPTLRRMRDVGLINEEEQKLLTELSRINRTDRIDSAEFLGKNLETLNEDVKGDKQTEHKEVIPNVYYVPLMWAVNLVNIAKTQQRITDAPTMKLTEEINNYRAQCSTMFLFDWVTIPLVYTQVVTIAVYTYFLFCLFGRQYLDSHELDLYIPIFTILQYVFYMGWLEVAQCLLNPFGGDDDDFEINPLIEDNLQVGFNMVDELCDFVPELEKDTYYNAVDVDIAYNARTQKYQDRRYQGSAVEKSKWDCWGLRKRKEEDTSIITKQTRVERPTAKTESTVIDVDPSRSEMTKPAAQTPEISEKAPELEGGKEEVEAAPETQQPVVGEQEQPVLEDGKAGVGEAPETQQPVVGEQEHHGDDTTGTGPTGGGES